MKKMNYEWKKNSSSAKCYLKCKTRKRRNVICKLIRLHKDWSGCVYMFSIFYMVHVVTRQHLCKRPARISTRRNFSTYWYPHYSLTYVSWELHMRLLAVRKFFKLFVSPSFCVPPGRISGVRVFITAFPHSRMIRIFPTSMLNLKSNPCHFRIFQHQFCTKQTQICNRKRYFFSIYKNKHQFNIFLEIIQMFCKLA